MSGGFLGADGAAEALRQSGLLAAPDLDRAERLARDRSMSLAEAAVALGLLTEDQALFVVAETIGMELVFPTGDGVDRELVTRFPAELLRRHDALPMLAEDDGAVVAFAEPPQRAVVQEFAKAAGVAVRPVLAARRRLRLALDQVIGGAGVADAARVSAHDFSGMTAFYRRLTAAFGDGADELRFEPTGAEVRVRVKRRGEETSAGSEPASVAAGVAARARMLAGLPTPDDPTPQAADFAMRVAGRGLALSLTILPAAAGEVVTLRRRTPCTPPADFALPDTVLAAAGGPGLVLVAATDRALTRAFVGGLLAETPADATVVCLTDDETFDAPGRVRLAPWADAAAAIRRARPDVLFADAGEDALLAVAAARAAGDVGTVVVALSDDVPEDALHDLCRAVGPRRAARCLAAVVLLEHARALCGACSLPEVGAPDAAGARVAAGCAACGRTGHDGTVVVATGVAADKETRARVARGAAALPGEATAIPNRWRALVEAGRVSRADAARLRSEGESR